MYARARIALIGVAAVAVAILTAVPPAVAQGAPENARPAVDQQPTYEQLKLQIDILQDDYAKLKDNAEKQSAALEATIEELQAKLAAVTQPPDPALEKAEAAAKLRELQYAKEKFDIAVDGYWEQRINSRVALVLLVLLVLAGIAFSAYQLWKSTQVSAVASRPSGKEGKMSDTTETGAENPASGANPSMASDLQISAGPAGNIRITSTVIGVLVLIISLAFFYIYMKELTSIRVVGDLGASAKVTDARQASGNAGTTGSTVGAAAQ
jgi:hypothetical protein